MAEILGLQGFEDLKFPLCFQNINYPTEDCPMPGSSSGQDETKTYMVSETLFAKISITCHGNGFRN